MFFVALSYYLYPCDCDSFTLNRKFISNYLILKGNAKQVSEPYLDFSLPLICIFAALKI